MFISDCSLFIYAIIKWTKKIIYDSHIWDRSILRNITKEQINEILLYPVETIKSKKGKGKYLSYKPYDFIKEFQTRRYLELVHTDKQKQVIYIISVIIKTRRELIKDGFSNVA